MQIWRASEAPYTATKVVSWILMVYCAASAPDWNQETMEPLRSGKKADNAASNGPIPIPTSFIQKAQPRLPGVVLVIWLRVALRCIPAYTRDTIVPMTAKTARRVPPSTGRGSNG